MILAKKIKRKPDFSGIEPGLSHYGLLGITMVL
jgi:hypothetical protein